MDSDQQDYPQPAPTDAEAYFEQALEYEFVDDYEKAIAACTQAIQLSPANAKYHHQRATVHFIASHWDEAIADYTEALRLKPDPTDDDEFNFTIADVYDHRATAYRYRGDYEAALADFAELIWLQPNNPRHYESRSVVYKLKGDFENSLADLYTVQRLDPDNPTCLTLIADVQLRQGNKTAAMTTYNEAVERVGSPASYLYRGQLWKEQGNLANAIADFEEAIRRYPQYDAAYFRLSETYFANGDFTKAIDALNTVMERGPGYRYIALLLRARMHLASGNLEQASKDFDETITENTKTIAEYPDVALFCVNRGHAHAAQGHIAEAVADYQKALELDPAYPESDVMREYIAKNS